jgi:PilZ domain
MRTSLQMDLMNAPQAKLQERRFSARIEADYAARLKGIDINDEPFREETRLRNLSAGGLYLQLKRTLREGSPVSVAVCLSTAPDPKIPVLRLAARGLVLRVEPQADGRYGVAVEFQYRRLL